VAIPPLRGEALAVYEATVACQMEAYERLIGLLTPVVEHFYYGIFPLRRGTVKSGGRPHVLARRTIPKRAQEIARYVLPVATFAYLYHTVSVVTLLRYYRLCQQFDAPAETQIVVRLMMQAVLDADPLLEKIVQEPLPLEETVEYQFWEERSAWSVERGAWSVERGGTQEAFRREFDEGLNGHTSRLVSWKADNEGVLAQAVREVLGLPATALSDKEAIGLVLDPGQNGYFGEAMNVTTMSKLARVLHHPSYTFRKKLSHTADSQDQRHRMTPGSRPMLTAYLTGEPDYITPELVCHEPAAQRLYEETMARTWEGIGRLRGLGVADEYMAYLLPNAVSIRFTESSDLMALHHKLRMRLCYNAQEEIFKASRDEALQIQAVNPEIGRYLGAPCTLRYAANSRPFCPEGDRYCGVPVWKLAIGEYQRVI
jgi:thymidylate synthase ThyX